MHVVIRCVSMGTSMHACVHIIIVGNQTHLVCYACLQPVAWPRGGPEGALAPPILVTNSARIYIIATTIDNLYVHAPPPPPPPPHLFTPGLATATAWLPVNMV